MFPRCASECGSTPEISLPHPLPRCKTDLASLISFNWKERPCSPSSICADIGIKASSRADPPKMAIASEVKARDGASHAVQCLGATPGSKLVTWLCKKVRHLKSFKWWWQRQEKPTVQIKWFLQWSRRRCIETDGKLWVTVGSCLRQPRAGALQNYKVGWQLNERYSIINKSVIGLMMAEGLN